VKNPRRPMRKLQPDSSSLLSCQGYLYERMAVWEKVLSNFRMAIMRSAQWTYSARYRKGQGWGLFGLFSSQQTLPVVIYVSVHETLKIKLEIGNWKYDLHAFVLLMNAFNFGSSFSTIVKSYQTISDNASAGLCQRQAFHGGDPLDRHKHTTRKLVSSLPVRARLSASVLAQAVKQTGLPNFYFPISSFKP